MNENFISFPNIGIDFNLSPQAFSIGNISIAWYGILIAIGLALAILYAFSKTERFGLDGDKTTDVIIAGIIGGIIGARTYYVLMTLDRYKTFWEMINIRNGGLAIYGGIIGAFLAGFITCKIKKMPMLPLFDVAAIGFCIGQAIGRWGNFFNQEAFGTNTNLPWGMTGNRIQNYIYSIAPKGYLENGKEYIWNQPVHPCFLYESIWCALGFILLSNFSKKRKYDGQIFLMYVGWYGLGRFFIEGLRTDSLYLGNIRISQLMAALCVITSVILLIVLGRKFKSENGGTSENIIADEILTEEEMAKEIAEIAEIAETTETTEEGK